MKAIRVSEFGAPEKMRLVEDILPEPGEDELIVALHAIGVNPVDTYMRAGIYPRCPELPYTPGLDGAGVVEKTGALVRHIALGSRVYVCDSLSGTYATHVLCKACQVYPLPEDLTFVEGACLYGPYFTAYHALFQQLRPHKEAIVLVHGASGGVGTACVQWACWKGLTVWGTAGTPVGMALVKAQGAQHVFNHHAPQYRQEILHHSHERGVDTIIEMLADVNLAHDMTLLATKGRVAVVGCRGEITINPRILMQKRAAIMGVGLFDVTLVEKEAIHVALCEAIAMGAVRPQIRATYPLAQADEAHIVQMTPGATGNIVLMPA